LKGIHFPGSILADERAFGALDTSSGVSFIDTRADQAETKNKPSNRVERSEGLKSEWFEALNGSKQ